MEDAAVGRSGRDSTSILDVFVDWLPAHRLFCFPSSLASGSVVLDNVSSTRLDVNVFMGGRDSRIRTELSSSRRQVITLIRKIGFIDIVLVGIVIDQ